MIKLKQVRPLSSLTDISIKKEIKTHREIPGMNGEKDKWGQREKTAIFKTSRGHGRNQTLRTPCLRLLGFKTVIN